MDTPTDLVAEHLRERVIAPLIDLSQAISDRTEPMATHNRRLYGVLHRLSAGYGHHPDLSGLAHRLTPDELDGLRVWADRQTAMVEEYFDALADIHVDYVGFVGLYARLAEITQAMAQVAAEMLTVQGEADHDR